MTNVLKKWIPLKKVIDLPHDHNLDQAVDKPTRIFDLLFTNGISSLQKTEMLPGMRESDHTVFRNQSAIYILYIVWTQDVFQDEFIHKKQIL